MFKACVPCFVYMLRLARPRCHDDAPCGNLSNPVLRFLLATIVFPAGMQRNSDLQIDDSILCLGLRLSLRMQPEALADLTTTFLPHVAKRDSGKAAVNP